MLYHGCRGAFRTASSAARADRRQEASFVGSTSTSAVMASIQPNELGQFRQEISMNRHGMRFGARLRAIVTFALAASLGSAASVVPPEECGYDWASVGTDFEGLPPIRAITVFDDGSGPVIYAGFSSSSPKASVVRRLVNGHWESLGVGLPGWVNALGGFDHGNGPRLHAIGHFFLKDGSSEAVLQFDGTGWFPLGHLSPSLTDHSVMIEYDDGNGPAMVVGGRIKVPGASSSTPLVKWTGTEWVALSSGTGWIRGLAVFDDGSGPALFVGGSFNLEPGGEHKSIAKWNGLAWSDVGGGISLVPDLNDGDPGVHCLTVHDDGSGPALFAGGWFNRAGNIVANGLAKWDGRHWRPVDTGIDTSPSVNNTVYTLTPFSDDEGSQLFIGGKFSVAGGLECRSVATWNGSRIQALGDGVGPLTLLSVRSAVTLPGSVNPPLLYIGGNFNTVGGIPSRAIAKWAPVADAPLVTKQPLPQDRNLGDTASLIAQVWGGDLAYQWFKDGHPLADNDHIGGATTDTLTISNVTADDEALYHLEAESPCGSAITQPALLNVICQFDIAPDSIDGVVNVVDLLAVLRAWGSTGNPGWIPADVDDDGLVGDDDLLAVIGAWGPCP